MTATCESLDDRYLYRLYDTVCGHRLVNIEPVGEVQPGPPGEEDARRA